MKKGLTIMCMALMFTGIFLMINWIPEASATTWTVGPGQQFQTIGQALAVAQSGDDIQVQCGTYNENLVITTSGILLIGVPNGAGARPIIQAINPLVPVVQVSAINFFMEQFEITGGSYGIYSNQVTGNQANPITFFMCEIYNNNVGIGIVNGAYHYIDYCDVLSNAQDGIQISGTHHEITSSNIYENGGHGIYSDSLSQSKISSCNVCTNVHSGIYIFNANNNNIWKTNIYNNGWEGLNIGGDYNDIDGYHVASIYNNYYSGSVGDTYDVWINGDYNFMSNYEIYQDQERNLQGRYGIYSAGPGNIYGNRIIDCTVHGYDGPYCAGVSIDNFDRVLGNLTYIHDNNVGLVMGTDTRLDCYNTQYAVNSENLKDNNISVVVQDYLACINRTYIKTSGSPDGKIGIKFEPQMKMILVFQCKIENMEIGIYLHHSANNNITEVDFTYLGYCVGINASTDINIIGKFPNENEMKYIQYEVVYAVNDSTNISSGKIHYYGEIESSYSVYLRGYEEDTKTLFVYHNLYGTWTISGSYYTWTTYQ